MSQPPTPEPSPRVVRRDTIHRGKKFDFEMLTVERPGEAGKGKTLQREIVRHPGAVVVVPILEEWGRRRVVLIRNYRIAAEEHLHECCAGTIERPRKPDGGFGPGEDPAACAARELIEETGYRAAALTPLGGPAGGNWFYTTPGLTDERMHAFAATGLTHVGQKLEEDETIEVEIVDAREAVAMATTGRLRDAKSMLAILLADRAGLL
jgi:ADP-ribose pyrophosphatase